MKDQDLFNLLNRHQGPIGQVEVCREAAERLAALSPELNRASPQVTDEQINPIYQIGGKNPTVWCDTKKEDWDRTPWNMRRVVYSEPSQKMVHDAVKEALAKAEKICTDYASSMASNSLGAGADVCAERIRALSAPPAAETPKCPLCGTHEIELSRICHNSACHGYAHAATVYEGWKMPAAPQEAKPAAADPFGLSEQQISKLLQGGFKPEEIGGAPELQHERVRELLHWFARLIDGNANPKWANRHASELAYYVATMSTQKHIDVAAVRQDGFIAGCNISSQERSMLERHGVIAAAPQEKAPVDKDAIRNAALQEAAAELDAMHKRLRGNQHNHYAFCAARVLALQSQPQQVAE